MSNPVPQNLDHQYLLERLEYDPVTGVFRWRDHPKLHERGRGCGRKPKPGDIAGKVQRDGYCRLVLDGRPYVGHRLAWFYTYGIWPTEDLDHINRDKADNRLVNLRGCSRWQNSGNRIGRARKATPKGVCYQPKTYGNINPYAAYFRTQYLGSFPTAELAHAAYAREADAYFGEFFWDGVEDNTNTR